MNTCDKDEGGVKQSWNSCDVIYGWPQRWFYLYCVNTQIYFQIEQALINARTCNTFAGFLFWKSTETWKHCLNFRIHKCKEIPLPESREICTAGVAQVQELEESLCCYLPRCNVSPAPAVGVWRWIIHKHDVDYALASISDPAGKRHIN